MVVQLKVVYLTFVSTLVSTHLPVNVVAKQSVVLTLILLQKVGIHLAES
jgi:hypothetical protein